MTKPVLRLFYILMDEKRHVILIFLIAKPSNWWFGMILKTTKREKILDVKMNTREVEKKNK